MLLTPENLHGYQVRATNHIMQHPGSMLWLDMGLGKTVITLTAINQLRAFGQINKVLVVAPLRVCQTVWEKEARDWSHTCHLKFSYVIGTAKKRLQHLHSPNSDIYLINYENLEWLSEQLNHFYVKKNRPLPFQMVVWDEVSKMKTSTTKRSKAFYNLISKFHRKVGLTGTPASNGLQDLHGQFLVTDGGARLGTHITHFRDRFMYQDGYSRRWCPFPESQKQIENLIHDVTLQMSASDYLEMPAFSYNDVMIRLPPSLRKSYDELERDMITQLEEEDGGHEVVVFNAAALTNKCLQFANGSVYIEPENPEFNEVHDLKIEALKEIDDQTGDKSLLVAYAYKSDCIRIMKAFPHAVNLSGMSGDNLVQAIESWNAGEIKMLVGHPASMGHGLNLQYGGHNLVWFGLNWSLDLYDQFNARINRQGQKMPVICHRIMVEGTVEQVVREALESKATTQSQLRAAIQKYAGIKTPAPLSFL